MARKPKPLTDAEIEAMLESIIRSEDAKPYERLQASTQLERRRERASKRAAVVDDELPPDPMEDLTPRDELAERRARRARA